MNENFPKVSVIIPMYNAEKYLSVCLESLLIQTFQDFEVIIVDDCSTDNSLAIAESFLERFGGRLKIISLEENTGSGAVPRNVGFEHASGKYIFFMDNDDLLIDIALETLYNYAEKNLATIVCMSKYFSCDEEIVPKNLTEETWSSDFIPDEAFFEPYPTCRKNYAILLYLGTVGKIFAPRFFNRQRHKIFANDNSRRCNLDTRINLFGKKFFANFGATLRLSRK